ncbi:hypothetical protein I215_08351 [Galbibacter marinus]|uniref:DUF3325 domain-containing protein n=1 Tax=Galbibacter marinus TaxID=555500 RepID=K2Q346_9FLAO|nr:hypothetical protein [Galbibacter marinus]EKF55241.1 hypothetical protein I215_08351 [Galbibacter marinus]
MTTLILLLTFAGFYALYNTSSRAELAQGGFDVWLRSQSLLKPAGVILLVGSLILTVLHKGLAAGILYYFVILSTIASLIIILCPLRIMNYKAVAIVFIGIVIAENLIL